MPFHDQLETVQKLREQGVPEEEINKMMTMIYNQILAKGQDQSQPEQTSQKEKDPGAEPIPMQ